MKQLFEKRYTKDGVRSFLVSNKDGFRILVFGSILDEGLVLKGVSDVEEQELRLSSLIDEGIPVSLKLFMPSVGDEEYYLNLSGISQYEEVVF